MNRTLAIKRLSETPFQYSNTCSVPAFTIDELKKGIRKMRKGRCADHDGINLEMFLHSGQHHLQTLLVCLNEVLIEDSIPSSWCDLFFTLLHRGGCVQDGNNWRPAAILSITYKIFARLVHDRI